MQMQSINTDNIILSLVNSIKEIKLEESEIINPDTILYIMKEYFKDCDITTLICYKYWIESEQSNINKNIINIKYLFFKLNNILTRNITELEFNFNITAQSVDLYNMITIDKFTKYNNDMKKIYNIICSKFNDMNYFDSSDNETESYDSSVYSENNSSESFLKDIENLNDSDTDENTEETSSEDFEENI